jgi:aminoglycoside 6'-N-acetyltransferase
MVHVRLRPAVRADIPLLESWDEEPHVAASDPEDDWGWDQLMEGALPGLENFVCEADGRPVGVVQILDTQRDQSRYWGDTGPGFRAIDIWIGPRDALGKGYGTAMLREALSMCFADPGVHTVLIDPLATNANAIRFYRRIGFTFLENRRFGDSQCAVHQFTRQTFEASPP